MIWVALIISRIIRYRCSPSIRSWLLDNPDDGLGGLTGWLTVALCACEDVSTRARCYFSIILGFCKPQRDTIHASLPFRQHTTQARTVGILVTFESLNTPYPYPGAYLPYPPSIAFWKNCWLRIGYIDIELLHSALCAMRSALCVLLDQRPVDSDSW